MALKPLKLFNLDPVTVVSAGVAYPITASPQYVASVSLQANYNNGGRVSVGGENVTNDNGILLDKGESAVIERPANTRDDIEIEAGSIYVTSTSSGDIVRVSILRRA